MNKRINEKIEEIEQFIQELNEIAPNNFDEYKIDLTKKAACERYAEKIMEAITDLAFLIIKEKNLKIPKEDAGAFFILSERGIISNELAQKLKDAKGMRNFLAHEYGKVDDEIIFNAVSEELEKDIIKQIKEVKNDS